MPVYEWYCKHCLKVTERMFRVSECPDQIKCACGKIAKKILSRGAVLTDDNVSWLPSAIKVLQPDYERPIETREEYKKYLKDHNLECTG